jgi:ankyrin repeat protein
MQLFLEKQFDLEHDANRLGRNPLHTAAKENWAEGVQWLLNNCPVLASQTDKSGLTPVFYTAIYGGRESFEQFLEHSDPAVVRTITGKSVFTGWTILHFMAQEGHSEMLGFVLQANDARDRNLFPDIDVQSTDPALTPLFVAARSGQTDCVQVLVARGADAAKENLNGRRTPREIARSGEIAALLSSRGAIGSSDDKDDLGLKANWFL